MLSPRNLTVLFAAVFTALALVAQPAPTAFADDAADAAARLAAEQAKLADAYSRLERDLESLAEQVDAAGDPDRAKLLRQAVAQSQEMQIERRMETLVRLLGSALIRDVDTAQNDQVEVKDDLQNLLRLLLTENRPGKNDSERDRIKGYIRDIERAINGETAAERLAARRTHSAALVAELESWMRGERARLSRHTPVAKALDYMLKRWEAFTRFLEDGRICLTNNAAERALRGLALGRKSWLFAGSDRGGRRAALIYTLIITAKMNDVEPEAWLADVLARIAETPQSQLHELLPWNWKTTQAADKLVA